MAKQERLLKEESEDAQLDEICSPKELPVPNDWKSTKKASVN
jgi:hypothetical protein